MTDQRGCPPDAPSDPALSALTGIPASAGRAAGPARMVRSVDEFSRVRPGDVLVCRTTDPAWTPLFPLVAGIVTEVGGALCHAAIVAREYGLPAVVGVADAMARLTDGRRVVVHGDLGTVTVPDPPERHR
jgi:pyruvate, water dikinase